MGLDIYSIQPKKRVRKECDMYIYMRPKPSYNTSSSGLLPEFHTDLDLDVVFRCNLSTRNQPITYTIRKERPIPSSTHQDIHRERALGALI